MGFIFSFTAAWLAWIQLTQLINIYAIFSLCPSKTQIFFFQLSPSTCHFDAWTLILTRRLNRNNVIILISQDSKLPNNLQSCTQLRDRMHFLVALPQSQSVKSQEIQRKYFFNKEDFLADIHDKYVGTFLNNLFI